LVGSWQSDRLSGMIDSGAKYVILFKYCVLYVVFIILRDFSRFSGLVGSVVEYVIANLVNELLIL
jgi:ABC-type polysaccharide transport system permease subunit